MTEDKLEDLKALLLTRRMIWKLEKRIQRLESLLRITHEDMLDPVTELGEALCVRWNKEVGKDKYSFDEETYTIISESGTGFDFMNHLREVVKSRPVR